MCRAYLEVDLLDSMDIIRKTKKGQHMNALERHHIYKNKKTYINILNDTYVEAENPIFEVIHKYTK
jgi:hypothetical protein